MIKRLIPLALVFCLTLIAFHRSYAFDILTPGDPIVAIDLDFTIGSSSPGAEGVVNILDGDINTKYLNFGVTNTGFIVTPAAAAAVRSFIVSTANDFPARDPATYRIFGTNDPITSVAHGDGRAENWTEISMGALALPDDRFAAGPAVGFANAISYSSYKMTFPTVKAAANSMQISEVAFFSSMDGTGTNLLAPGNSIIPIRDVDPAPSSNSPAAEGALNAIDRNINSKYLNFGEERSGFIVTPSAGSFIVNGFQIVTANDAEVRDPASWQLYGTNDPIVTPNNGIGNAENWTLIDSGALSLPADRLADGPIVPINNTQGAFSSYRMIFPTVKDAAAANSMQIAEFKLFAADEGVLEVNRQTGEVKLRALVDITMSNYEIRSLTTQALNSAAWTSITSTGADPNDTWAITSAPGAKDKLSEADTPTGANNGFTLTAGSTYSFGNIWGKVPGSFEDLAATFRKIDGNPLGVGVEYIGTVIPLGDYSGNGSVGPEDWPMFRAGYGGQYTGASAYEAYLGGDLDGDFDSDVYDFRLFVTAAGGFGALFGEANVPEPSCLALFTFALIVGAGSCRRRATRSMRLPAGAGTIVLLFLTAATVQAQTFTNVGGRPVGITIPAGQQNENLFSGPANLFDDDYLDDPGTIDEELFELNYNDPNLNCGAGACTQYAGLNAMPKVVFFDYGTSVSANWFAYAQRSGGDPTADRVGMFEFWFSNTDFGGTVPASNPDAVVKLLPTDARLRDSVLRPYSLSGTRSGRYVAMRLTVSELSANQPTNNIGGHEFRLLSGPADVVLQVNRANGALTINNNLTGAQAIDIKSYTIESPTGSLFPASFNGVRGDTAAFPAGNGSGNGWEIGGGSNPGRLAEAYFSGTSTLAIGAASISLGNGYNHLTLAEDLVFTWINSDGETYNARVEYIGVAPNVLPGDYNNNGVVDAADYTRWRDALGSSTVLPNDPTPGVVDQSDYDRWKTNFGKPGGVGSLVATAATVPEPATWLIFSLVILSGCQVRNRIH